MPVLGGEQLAWASDDAGRDASTPPARPARRAAALACEMVSTTRRREPLLGPFDGAVGAAGDAVRPIGDLLGGARELAAGRALDRLDDRSLDAR